MNCAVVAEVSLFGMNSVHVFNKRIYRFHNIFGSREKKNNKAEQMQNVNHCEKVRLQGRILCKKRLYFAKDDKNNQSVSLEIAETKNKKVKKKQTKKTIQ